jgi:hypothetical protein
LLWPPPSGRCSGARAGRSQPPSDTVKAVVEKGVSMEVMGQAGEIVY